MKRIELLKLWMPFVLLCCSPWVQGMTDQGFVNFRLLLQSCMHHLSVLLVVIGHLQEIQYLYMVMPLLLVAMPLLLVAKGSISPRAV